jgi:hypothetical protein
MKGAKPRLLLIGNTLETFGGGEKWLLEVATIVNYLGPFDIDSFVKRIGTLYLSWDKNKQAFLKTKRGISDFVYNEFDSKRVITAIARMCDG